MAHILGVSQDCSTSKVDLVFVVDSSGSIQASGSGNWQLIRQFIANIVDKLTIGEAATRVGLVRYANEGENIFYLNTYSNKYELRNAVLALRYEDGNTNTSGGIRVMHRQQFTAVNGDRSTVSNVAIIITDGVSTWDKERTIPDANAARNDGIRIFSVGITNAIDENELRLMSSPPQEENKNYWRSAEFNQLNLIVDSIVQQACSIMDSGNIQSQENQMC